VTGRCLGIVILVVLLSWSAPALVRVPRRSPKRPWAGLANGPDRPRWACVCGRRRRHPGDWSPPAVWRRAGGAWLVSNRLPLVSQLWGLSGVSRIVERKRRHGKELLADGVYLRQSPMLGLTIHGRGLCLRRRAGRGSRGATVRQIRADGDSGDRPPALLLARTRLRHRLQSAAVSSSCSGPATGGDSHLPHLQETGPNVRSKHCRLAAPRCRRSKLANRFPPLPSLRYGSARTVMIRSSKIRQQRRSH